MAKLNPDLNVKQSQNYDDSLDPANAETSATSLTDDVNYVRSEIKDITGEANWFDKPVATLREIAAQTGTTKRVLYRTSELQQIYVPLAQNFVALNNLNDYPSEVMAIASESNGAIVALLPGAAGAMHSMNVAVNNSNLVLVRVAGTNLNILDSLGRPLLGLLQVDSDATDGAAFTQLGDDASQISFVILDPTTDSLSAANTATIGGETIEYAYNTRKRLIDAPEDFAKPLEDFSLPIAQATGVTVNDVIDPFIVAINGQTVFTLSAPALATGVSLTYLNGVAYKEGEDYIISGTTYTWLNTDFQLELGEEITISYQTI
jgi:hypothetical protein